MLHDTFYVTTINTSTLHRKTIASNSLPLQITINVSYMLYRILCDIHLGSWIAGFGEGTNIIIKWYKVSCQCGWTSLSFQHSAQDFYLNIFHYFKTILFFFSSSLRVQQHTLRLCEYLFMKLLVIWVSLLAFHNSLLGWEELLSLSFNLGYL